MSQFIKIELCPHPYPSTLKRTTNDRTFEESAPPCARIAVRRRPRLRLAQLCRPAARPPHSATSSCPTSRNIENWHSTDQLERKGFNVELFGNQASLGFQRDHGHQYAALDLAANPTSASYTASRISEIDGTLPIAQRIKCWQAS